METEGQGNFFGDRRVEIEGNPTLESAANVILRVVDQDPALLEGDKVGIIDRNIRLAVWFEQGLSEILTSLEQKREFIEWANNPKRCVDSELLRRARQHLVKEDKIRLSAAAIKQAERENQRLGRAFAGR
jgi:hypothetical protein